MDKTTIITQAPAIDLEPATAGGSGAPQWVQLFPAGQMRARDGRRWKLDDPEAVIRQFQARRVDLPVDYEHQADSPMALANGPVPAAGWIRELRADGEGLWGRVEWTDTARKMIEAREYRYISPSFLAERKTGKIVRLKGAGLVHRPALHLKALASQQENEMDWMEYLRELLGLGSEATDDDIRAALDARLKRASGEDDEQAAMSEIARALGLSGVASQAEILAAIGSRSDGAEGDGAGGVASHAAAETITALQSELAGLTAQLNAVEEARARDLAERFIDEEIRRGRVGVKPLRDHYIARHMSDPESVETEIAALPVLEAGRMTMTRTPAEDGKVALNAAEQEAARLIGVDVEDYAKALAAERKHEEAL